MPVEGVMFRLLALPASIFTASTMSADYTQQQSNDEQRRAQELSLQRNSPPAEVPGYQIEDFLGEGAYGEVWVGIDQNTGRRVAIKFYTHRGGVDWSLLSREVEKLVFLSADRYVVQLLDVGWEADPPYYVMDYIENGSLEDLLKQYGPRPVPEAVEMFREVAVGLMHLHGKGVLHCDLKPANVLLDSDHKPRLADFGQSRLSDEQSPALGTLFYMAPEQADLEAVPDARWDVYALGALLFCMLTGDPPHRNEDTVSEIDTAANLIERLTRYRTVINASKPATGHRNVPGGDRALFDIVDRCLAPNPKDRYASVQSVLEALKAREEARAQRPLLVLGLVGPLLLLTVMFVIGWVAYGNVMGTAHTAVAQRTQQSTEFASKFAARGVAAEINQYFDAVEKVAADAVFLSALRDAVEEADAEPTPESMQALREALRDPNQFDVEKYGDFDDWRTQLDTHTDREELQGIMERLLPGEDASRESSDGSTASNASRLISELAKLRSDSWFVCDKYGTQIAAKFPDKPAIVTLGKNYRWRTYFHGSSSDLVATQGETKVFGNAPQEDTGLPEHIERTHISAVFKSQATGAWKVAIATPVFADESHAEFLGIVAVTVEVGNFIRGEQFAGTEQQFAVLVDGRPGDTRGTILQHPLYKTLLKQEGKSQREKVDLLGHLTEAEFHVPLDEVAKGANGNIKTYTDPLGHDAVGKQYDQPWLAAQSPVLLSNRKLDTGLVVLVQESRDAALAPIYQLGNLLFYGGIGALLLLGAVVVAMWFFVAHKLREPRGASGRSIGDRSTTTQMHNMETVAAPASHRSNR